MSGASDSANGLNEQPRFSGLPIPKDEAELKRRVTHDGEFRLNVEVWVRGETEYHVLPDLKGEFHKQIALSEHGDSIEIRTFDRAEFTPSAEKEGEISATESLFAEVLEAEA